jgi:hypothetical protein
MTTFCTAFYESYLPKFSSQRGFQLSSFDILNPLFIVGLITETQDKNIFCIFDGTLDLKFPNVKRKIKVYYFAL